MSNTYSVTLPDGRKVSRTSVRDYTHAIAYRPLVMNTAEDPDWAGDYLGDWKLDGFRSSERLANYQASRLRNAGEPEVLVLPVDAPKAPAPVQYLQSGKLVDGWGNLTEENVPGVTLDVVIPENIERTGESWDEATDHLSQAAAIESALDDAVHAFLGGRQVSGRSWSKIRESLRPAIVAAAPHLQSPAWERGYEDRGTDEALSDLIETGAAQATVDPYLNGVTR